MGIVLGKGTKNIQLGGGLDEINLGSANKAMQLQEGIKSLELSRPKSEVVLDHLPAGGWSFTWTFGDYETLGAVDIFEFAEEVTFRSIQTTNISGYTIELNGVVQSTFPFTATKWDKIIIYVIKTNPTTDAILKLTTDPHVQDDRTELVQPYIDKSRKHIFVLCGWAGSGVAQYIAIIDTETDTVHSTISLPIKLTGSQQGYTGIWYNSLDDSIGACHGHHYVRIEANPDSPNFGLVVNADRNPSSNYTFYRSNGTGYSWANCLYDPFRNVVWGSQHAYSIIVEFHPFNSFGCHITDDPERWSRRGMNNWSGTLMPNGNIFGGCFIEHMFELDERYDYVDGSAVRRAGIIKQTLNGTGRYSNGTRIYIPSINKYFSICGRFKRYKYQDMEPDRNWGTKYGYGTSADYQRCNFGDYSPDFDLVMGTDHHRQTSEYRRMYFHWPMLNNPNDYGGTTNDYITNVTTNNDHMPQVKYSHFSKKFYLFCQKYNGRNTLGFVNVYDPQLWIDGGKLNINQAFVKTIPITVTSGCIDHGEYMCKFMAGNWLQDMIL
jgi:hypothetical protein